MSLGECFRKKFQLVNVGKLTASKLALFSVSGLNDEKSKQTYVKTETCELYFRDF